MIELTERAAKAVRDARASDSTPAGYCLRFRVESGGCSGFVYDAYMDEPRADDLKGVSHEVEVLIDELSALYLDGTVVDWLDGPEGGFVFLNPKLEPCACGASFRA
jgi:iron-sulfur cluster assembly protein